MDRPFFIVVRCVVVVTQDEADFRFGLSPEGAQAQWREGGRLLAEAELRRVVAVGGGETKTFARLGHLKRSSRTQFLLTLSAARPLSGQTRSPLAPAIYRVDFKISKIP